MQRMVVSEGPPFDRSREFAVARTTHAPSWSTPSTTTSGTSVASATRSATRDFRPNRATGSAPDREAAARRPEAVRGDVRVGVAVAAEDRTGVRLVLLREALLREHRPDAPHHRATLV